MSRNAHKTVVCSSCRRPGQISTEFKTLAAAPDDTVCPDFNMPDTPQVNNGMPANAL